MFEWLLKFVPDPNPPMAPIIYVLAFIIGVSYYIIMYIKNSDVETSTY